MASDHQHHNDDDDQLYNQYKTHFYCALCGGPFAQVYRTSTATATSTVPGPGPAAESAAADVGTEVDGGAAEVGAESAFSIPEEENVRIPEEVVLQNMGYAASRHREHRIKATEKGMRRGIMSEINRQAWKAYDGRRISTAQMEWTSDLIALIHERAKNVPEQGRQFFNDGLHQFLTGRGRIRQVNAWADAHHEYEEENEMLPPPPPPAQGVQDNGQYGFQVYQEFGRLDSEFIISSIPFHLRCWRILGDAIDVSADERGLNVDDDLIDEDLDLLWGHLRGLVGMSAAARWLGHSESILSGPTRGEVVTRLGEVDYREAQGSGEGYQWRHDEGLHWIAADPEPSATRFADEPLLIVDKSVFLPATTKLPPFKPYRVAYNDCFHSFPPEIVVEVFRYLTSTDIFSLKQASAAAYSAEIPMLMYKRFMQEEFDYYPPVVAAVEKFKDGTLLKSHQKVDWKGSFERLRRAIRTPEPEEGKENGSEWDEIDISLKNRNRIWKIVKPLAEEYVETSPTSLRQKYGATRQIAQRTSVVRGCVGTRSGREGVVESAYFGYTRKPKVEGATAAETANEDDEESEDIVVANELVRVRVYRGFLPELRDSPRRNYPDYAVCGLEFLTMEDGEEGEKTKSRRFGRRSPLFEDIEIGEKKHLIGFVFCFVENVVGGIRLVFRDNTFSRPIGKWDGGVMRKVIAPPDYRTLVGVTGFINSSGFIEKIGLLEETLPRCERDVFGALPIPPLQVDLSHDESSVWNRLPPTNVRFLEREGQNVRNWRLHKAEWEIWSPGYREDGDLHPNSPESRAWARKSLREIVGYYDKDCLRGLQFKYDTSLGPRDFVIGATTARLRGSLTMSVGEEISAVVICFDVNGVTGILFVTDRGRTSQVFGPRYVGTHKVFGPLLAAGKKSTHHRHDLQGVRAVVGLHCLFDNEAQRFLQLGLIIPEEDDADTVAAVATLRPIPFDEIDENCLQWEDIPLPQHLVVQRQNDDLLSSYSRDVNLTGWVDLSLSVKKIVVSCRMRGIRFVFCDANIPDKYFGDIEEENEGTYEQNINGARIVGVYTLGDEDGEQEEEVDVDDDQASVSVSSINDDRKELPQLWFLTTENEHLVPSRAFPEVKDRELKGLKFDFSSKKLHSWRPIYSAASEVKFPWNKKIYKINQPLRNTCAMAFKLFGDPISDHYSGQHCRQDDEDRVDAVKGYITREGLFCGLLFRRRGEWSEDVFGARSSFEITEELAEGERFVSAWISGTSAIALVMNTGRCTPWFGKVKNPKDIQAPGEEVAVGVYGAVESTKLDRVDWSALGLLYRRTGGTIIKSHEYATADPPRLLTFFQTDPQTNLPWFSDINQKPPIYELAPLASGKVPTPKRERVTMRINGVTLTPPIELWRAYVSYDPGELEQVRFYVNRDLKNKGLRALRLRGTPRMGLITMGEWCYTDTVVKRKEKMRIEGPDGERIKRMQVWYQRFTTEDRVVGVVIETSTGRQKKIFSYDEVAVRRDPTHVKPVSVWLECKDGYEVVGFHGVFSTNFMHDIGLVLRPVGETGPLVRQNGNGIGGASSRTSWHSHNSGMSESTYTDATAVSPDSSGNAGNGVGDLSRYVHSPSPVNRGF